jgi:hypothetical protein
MRAIRPSWQCTQKEKHQQDDQNDSQHGFSLSVQDVPPGTLLQFYIAVRELGFSWDRFYPLPCGHLLPFSPLLYLFLFLWRGLFS